MGKILKKKATICAVVDQAILAAIEDRRDPLTLSRSAYMSLILQKWIEEGCPPVSPADAAIQELQQEP